MPFLPVIPFHPDLRRAISMNKIRMLDKTLFRKENI